MWLLFLVVIFGGLAAFMLEWYGKHNAAMFLGLATTALGVLCPSPFQKPHTPATQQVDAPNADTVNVQAAPGPAVPAVAPVEVVQGAERGQTPDSGTEQAT